MEPTSSHGLQGKHSLADTLTLHFRPLRSCEIMNIRCLSRRCGTLLGSLSSFLSQPSPPWWRATSSSEPPDQSPAALYLRASRGWT